VALSRRLVGVSRQFLAFCDPAPKYQKLPPESVSSDGLWLVVVQSGSPFNSSIHNQLINAAIMVSSKADSFKTFS